MKTLALTLVGACLGTVLMSQPVPGAAADQAYWYDGTVRRPLWIDRGSGTISPTAPRTDTDPKSAAAATDAERAAKVPPLPADGTTPQAARPIDPAKVRRGASEPRNLDSALPGGVLVSLKEPLKEAEARAFLSAQGVTPVRELGTGTGIWLIASPAGEASLQLANRLYESGQFALAQPNWRSDMQTR